MFKRSLAESLADVSSLEMVSWLQRLGSVSDSRLDLILGSALMDQAFPFDIVAASFVFGIAVTDIVVWN